MVSIQANVTTLSGVGPKKAQALADLGIVSVGDLLSYFPFRFDDFAPQDLSQTQEGQKIYVAGIVVTPPVTNRFGKRSRTYFRLKQGDNVILVNFWNQAYISRQLHEGQKIGVMGVFERAKQTLTATKLVANAKAPSLSGVYRASQKIKANTIKTLVKTAFTAVDEIPELLPEKIRAEYGLLDYATCLHQMHFPKNAAERIAARKSAAFYELFCFEATLSWLKLTQRTQDGIQIDYDAKKIAQLAATFAFELTQAQKRVVNEICADLKQPYAMNRLLQGDVGSGKTVVAALAMYAAASAGYQAALMAPTAILATQHAKKLAKIFEPLGVSVALLTSNTLTHEKQRQTTLEAIAAGKAAIVVGTHAIIQPDVKFKNLGLAITDEQHRFGVNQRHQLAKKAPQQAAANVLAMTATPIPRTLALTAYGEMEVSVIDEKPANRQPVKTLWLKKRQQKAALDLIKQEVIAGRQAYVVSPLVEQSEQLSAQNATDVAEKLTKYYHNQFKIGLLHGKLKAAQKDNVMNAFAKHEIDILVATTVVEVGVDVANASVMVILDAQRFGLAQLHQLRGRVGRSDLLSYCVLLGDPTTQVGKKRLQTLVDTNDGFELAEADLKLRGPGDMLGLKQAGLPVFQVADVKNDLLLLQKAKQAAWQVVTSPDFASQANYQTLKNYIKTHSQVSS